MARRSGSLGPVGMAQLLVWHGRSSAEGLGRHVARGLSQRAALHHVVNRFFRHGEVGHGAVAHVSEVLDANRAGVISISHHPAGPGKEGDAGVQRIYGVGGGAIIAPFAMTSLGLPAKVIAGPSLLATLITSLVGIGSFEVLRVRPDWTLGLLFGAGGLAGSYCGARLQKHLPDRYIRLFLGLLLAGLSATYIFQFFH